MFKKNGCYHGSHKFEPRYDEKMNPNNLNISGMSVHSASEARKLIYYKVYVHDICVKCGKTIKRS